MESSPFSFTYRGRLLPTDEAPINILIRRAMNDILDHAERTAKSYAPRRTGNLFRNIDHEGVSHTGSLWSGGLVVKKSAPYAQWVESGTGIFGPHHTPIVPTTGNFLRFKVTNHYRGPRGGAHHEDVWVYRRSVKGQKAQRFMMRAYQDTNRYYAPARLRVLQREIAASFSNRTT
jgi:hypothetical protein